MDSKKINLAAASTLTCLVAVACWNAWRSDASTSGAQTPSVGHSSKVWRRVDGDDSDPKFRAWVTELTSEPDLPTIEVLRFLLSDVTDLQKTAVLETYLEELPEDGAVPDASRWRESLAQLTQGGALSTDLGIRMAELIDRVATQSERDQLERYYKEQGRRLPEGNKVAVVRSSRNEHFLDGVLKDPSDAADMHEQALERLGELGQGQQARELALHGKPGQDSAVTLTAMRVAGQTAEEPEDFQQLIEASKRYPEPDRFGRRAANMAYVGISNSQASGKSEILLGQWEGACTKLMSNASTEEELIGTLVLGKSLSHALWSERDASAVRELIVKRLAPFLVATLEQTKAAAPLQAMVDFAIAFRGECEMRPEAACDDANDARNGFRAQLPGLMTPYLQGELAVFLGPLNQGG